MYADYHIHSFYSDDSMESMEKTVKEAIRKGLDEICFTDHVDYGIKKDFFTGQKCQKLKHIINRYNVFYPLYFRQIEYLKNKYKDKITIKAGLEFGLQVHTIDLYNKLFNRYPLDFVLCSIHEIDDKEFWGQQYQNGKTQDEYMQNYYDEMYKIVSNYKNYSVLAHVDMINRYDLVGSYPFEKIKDKVEKILKKVIEDGKGIEINTSSFVYKLNDYTPARDIIQLYYDLGGRIITIGSDAHVRKNVGTHFDEARKLLKEIGFTHYCTFDKMQPQYIEL